MTVPGELQGIGARLLGLARRPVPVTRRQAFAGLGAAVGLGTLGLLWHANRFEVRNAVALHLWLPTPYDRELEMRSARAAADAIRPLFARMPRPRMAEWLSYFEEPGQTLNAYAREVAPAAREVAGEIQVLPFGDFDERRFRMVADTVALAEIFYGRAARLLPVEPVPPLPPGARTGSGKDEQLDAGQLLEWLTKRVPAAVPALVALTPVDLSGGAGFNFVFGMASLVDRVGVWSLHRLTAPRLTAEKQFRRVAGTALHELGHMFGLWHCTAYQCCMSGANTLEESDGRPLAFCPECDAKVCWRFRLEPGPRYARLAEFAAARGLADDARLWERCAQAVRA